MNTLQAVTIASPYGETEECALLTIEDTGIGYLLDDIAETGQQYTLQFWLKSAADASVTVAGKTFSATTAWTECVTKFEAASPDLVFAFSTAGTYYIFEPQLETGNQQTDYSEAPEDAEERMDYTIKITAEGLWESIRSVQSDLTGTTERVTEVAKTAEGITERVEEIVVGQDDLETRMKSAEEKITPDAIVSTVRNSDGYKTDQQTIIKQTSDSINMAVKDKVTQDDVNKSISEIDTFNGSSVTIDNSGVAVKSGGTFSVETGAGVTIKSGGTFSVDSAKFEIDGSGNLSAGDATISGQLSVDGNDVWHKGILIVSTAAPSNPSSGTIWVKPDMSAIPAAGTWSLNALTSRPDVWTNNYDYALSGTNIGAAPSNATYTYEVSVPVYYGYNGSGACNVTVYLGASSGATTISMGTKTFSNANKGGNMYTATVTSGTWLGNSGTIYMRVNFSAPNLMTVNSHSPFTCTLTAKSSSATGWKICEVQMYMG